jgi:hypothetical protein
MQLAFPFGVDARGRTALADDDAHVAQLIEQVLFTAPGERVNRPTFGTGLLGLVFAPNSPELTTATQLLVQGALQQWLNELATIEQVLIRNEEQRLQVTVGYRVRRTQQRHVAKFVREV